MPFIGNKPTALPLSSNDLEDNIISTAKIQDNAVTPAKYIEPVPFRNIIINGDMSIAQRGTSVSSITSSGYNTVDRFRLNLSSLGTWTQSQSTDVPSGQGFGYSQKLDCTTANASPSASAQFIFEQKIEAQNLQYLKKGTASAESLTLSFWVKSNKTGTYIAELFDDDNNRQISKAYTINSASTWEKKTITYDGDTTGTLNNDNGSGLRVNLWLGAGSNTTSGTLSTTWTNYSDPNRAVGQVNLADSTSNYINITGVQLEAGTTASDFEFLPYDVNKNRCLRYCYAFGDYGAGNVTGNTAYSSGYATSAGIVHISYPQTMRANPTLTYSQYAGATSNDFSNISKAQLYDSNDNSWLVFDFIAEAEL